MDQSVSNSSPVGGNWWNLYSVIAILPLFYWYFEVALLPFHGSKYLYTYNHSVNLRHHETWSKLQDSYHRLSDSRIGARHTKTSEVITLRYHKPWIFLDPVKYIFCGVSVQKFEISHKFLNLNTTKYAFYCLLFLRVSYDIFESWRHMTQWDPPPPRSVEQFAIKRINACVHITIM